MDWAPQQVRALDSVGRWLQSKDKPYFQLAGYAGTGKTTLAKHLVESVKGGVYFAAYTGKAAYVLQRSGAKNVSTIHKLIYMPAEKSKQRLRNLEAERAKLLTNQPIPTNLVAKLDKEIKSERENMARPMFKLNLESVLNSAALVVIDEYSMVSEDIGKDLMSFNCPILALGDPGQLPPVYGKPFFKNKPDVLLTEIHRQALDNPIIQMSKDVREGKNLKTGSYGDSVVVDRNQLSKDALAETVLSADQLLVGRNATRQTSNNRVRELRGFKDPLPVAQDKLVCLKNNHEAGLLNGQLWKVEENLGVAFDDSIELSISNEEGEKLNVSAHQDYFKGEKPDFWDLDKADQFDYGYALTVHKSQGSQWDNIVLFDEWFNKDRQKWLYTGITRAAEKISLIKL